MAANMVTSEERKHEKLIISVNDLIKPIGYYGCQLLLGYIKRNCIY